MSNALIQYRQPKPLSNKLRDEIAFCAEHPDKILFLDIETTGLSHYYDEITVVGWSLAGASGTFIKGQSPNALFEAARSSVAMVTFNGIRFDQRFLKQEFAEICLPQVHVDLMYLCRRVGLTGGQKAIEIELGVNFREDLQGVDGFAAVLLWHRYLRGDIDALKLLIAYNRADIAAMGSLFDAALERLDYKPDLIGEHIKFEEWSAPDNMLVLPEKISKPHKELTQAPSFRELFGGSKAEKSKIVGIDLTGSEARATGWCFLDGHFAETEMISSDNDIVAKTIEKRPDLISIDSPLCLPAGRQTVFDDDPSRDEFGIMRICERELKRRGINVYPSLLPSMQKLTARGIMLSEKFRKLGFSVIESYPGAAQDIMRIPRKGAGEEWLKLGLKDFGIEGGYIDKKVTHDELDAITSALVGTFHLAGLSEGLAGPDEEPMIIPIATGDENLIIGVSGKIAAGKTTAARALESNGYSYTRISQVIDDVIVERGLEPNRDIRQAVGIELHKDKGQRWLCQKALERIDSNGKKIVVDGLRWEQDVKYLGERFGGRFLHLHIAATDHLRKKRSALNENATFEKIDVHKVEEEVEALDQIADVTIDNNLDIASFIESVLKSQKDYLGRKECR